MPITSRFPKAKPDSVSAKARKKGVNRGIKAPPTMFTPEGDLTEQTASVLSILTREDKNQDKKALYDWSHIQQRVKIRRQAFAIEYLKDFNARNAIARMGLQYANPNQVARDWMAEPYTKFCIDENMRLAQQAGIVTHNEVLFGLKKEANSFGEDSSVAARVSAWKTIGRILGMEITRVEGKMLHGVMAIPFSDSPEEWDKRAQKSQQKLLEDVRK